ncbi:thioredoxin domain-containing protein [Shewanella putrefaciens]|uniref:thioredoxin domain-containing protein n=1 Tax=Shewanella putrefaciens TaxID=24 RepID=UPI0021BE61E1|nr:thioredoxin domain-containing protein [Shewanella putrefaciens]UXK08496.1 thioredoxin domain-containing protein [Shewanella putrefaciens]
MKQIIEAKDANKSMQDNRVIGATAMSKFNSLFSSLLKNRKLQMFAVSGVAMAMLVVSLPSLTTSAHAKDSSLSAAQQQEVRAIIKDALINDPDLMREAILAWQAREQQGADAAMQASLASHHQAMYETKSDPWKGAATPEISMVYFTDFNCPYCKKIEPSLNKLIEEFPQLKIIIKMVPLQGEGSQMAVDFAQTVWLNEPEKYLKVKDMLMSSPRGLDAAAIAKVAKLTDTERWVGNTDERVAKMVDDNINLMNDLGIGGTPSMIVADTLIPGLVPYEELKAQLEAAIAAKDKTQKIR